MRVFFLAGGSNYLTMLVLAADSMAASLHINSRTRNFNSFIEEQQKECRGGVLLESATVEDDDNDALRDRIHEACSLTKLMLICLTFVGPTGI